MRAVDLKKEHSFIDQYVDLRNSYTELLFTSRVSRADTEKWLAGQDVEVLGLAEGDALLGVAVLYPGKEGEIAFFVKYRNRGIGTRLLALIEDAARSRGLPFVRAWTLKDNAIAQRVFEKSGFEREGIQKRVRGGAAHEGVAYKKKLGKDKGGIPLPVI
ncbi:MAG TPA: GNAT family N-acetyltransferase [Dissulfurispiraceae bacterium]|nr:GNAT family N-acetyltransferase [Dissulfurispiraceae bacterium]